MKLAAIFRSSADWKMEALFDDAERRASIERPEHEHETVAAFQKMRKDVQGKAAIALTVDGKKTCSSSHDRAGRDRITLISALRSINP